MSTEQRSEQKANRRALVISAVAGACVVTWMTVGDLLLASVGIVPYRWFALEQYGRFETIHLWTTTIPAIAAWYLTQRELHGTGIVKRWRFYAGAGVAFVGTTPMCYAALLIIAIVRADLVCGLADNTIDRYVGIVVVIALLGAKLAIWWHWWILSRHFRAGITGDRLTTEN